MHKKALAGATLALMGMGLATPAAAEDWRACVVGACLQSVCGNNDASVLVSMGTDVSDPEVGGTVGLKTALLRSLYQRNQEMTGEPLMHCTPSQPSQSAADQMSQNIFAQMSTTFRDVRLISPNDLIHHYDSVPGSKDPRYNGGADSSATASNDDGGAAAAQAQAEREAAQADAQRAREAEAERQAEQRRRERAQAEADAQAQRDREARQKAMAEQEARNSNDDANQCVSGATLKSNDTFQGNTAAYVTNGCGRPVDVRICLMTEEKGWNCGMTYGLSPQSSWSWSSMKAAGGVFQDARISGSNRAMRNP